MNLSPQDIQQVRHYLAGKPKCQQACRHLKNLEVRKILEERYGSDVRLHEGNHTAKAEGFLSKFKRHLWSGLFAAVVGFGVPVMLLSGVDRQAAINERQAIVDQEMVYVGEGYYPEQLAGVQE